MKKSWNVSQLIPLILSVFTVGLIVALLVGSFNSADRSTNAIREIDQVHFPVLEDLAVGARLQQSLDFLLELSIESRDPKYVGEYELARELLGETVVRVNHLVSESHKALGEIPPVDRSELSELEQQVLTFLNEGQFASAKKLKDSETYIELKSKFSEQMFLMVQSVSEAREHKLVEQQSLLEKEYMTGAFMVAVVSLFLILIAFLWAHANRKNRQLEVRAQSNARLAALGEMAGGVAHEINNPLAIIDGSVDMCLREMERGNFDLEKMAYRLNKVRSTVLRITKIVKGLKRFSREPDSEEVREYAMIQIVNESLDLSREKIKAMGIEVHVDVPENLKIRCNFTEFSQVIINLVNNSIDEVKDKERPWIQIRARADAKNNILSIVDSGSGIPENIAKHIMQPFYTTKAIGEGTGLGLSISHGIVKKLGGDLLIDSSSPNTKFDVVLPLNGPEKEAS